MTNITTINARTQCIELAVKELSNRDSVTMTDVREYMDTLVTKKIPTGKKSKYTDPNGEEHEYEIKAPIHEFYSYKADENEIYSRTIQTILTNKKFFHELKDNVKVSDVIKWAAVNANFVDKDDISEFVIWLLETINDVKNTCKTGSVNKARQNDTQLEFNSTTKGSGKSHFIEELVRKTQEAGIEAKKEVSLPEGGFYNTLAESTNLIVGYKERVYQKLDEATLMSIGRHEDYTYTEKGKMAINIPANAITIGSTNGNPYCKDDRCYKVIRCIPTDYATRLQTLQTSTNSLQTLLNDVTVSNTMIYNSCSEKVCKFVSLLQLDKERNLKNNNSKSSFKTNKQTFADGICNGSRRIPGINTLQEYLGDISTGLEQLSFVSVKGLYKLWEKNTGKKLEGLDKYKSFEKPISECLNYLFSRKLVKGRGPNNDMQRQYNLFEILEDILNYDVSYEEITIDDIIIQAAEEWGRIIKMAEDFEKPDPEKKKFLHEDAQEVKFPANFIYKETEYSKPTVRHGEDVQFIVSNPVKSECIQGVIDGKVNPGDLAQGDYLENTNFVFECDNVSVEEQKEMVENLPEDVKKSIISVTSSGADSVHILLKTTCHDKAARKAIWEHLSNTYFGGKADESCSNNSRLTPNPNAIRNRKHKTKPQFVGCRQTCFYFNPKPEPLYVDNIVLRERQKSEDEARKRKEMFKSDYSGLPKPDLTVETLKARVYSQARNYAIRLLEGTIEHGPDAVSGLKYLLATGFDEADLWQSIPLLSWKEKEFQGMIDYAKKGL